MNTILLILCNALSCFIISTILFQFMNGKYERSSQNRYVYIVVETVTVIFTTCINMLNHSILNLVVWGVSVSYTHLMSVFTRWYSYETGINDRFGDY